MKNIISLIAVLFLYSGIYAQNETDALRYSETEFGGTARYMGVAGAFGAVGGDFSSLSSNPAGMGFYRSSEFSISPIIHQSITNSFFLGINNEDSKYNIALQNVGVVLALTTNKKNSDWNNFQFGIGKNRLKNFNNRIYTEGYNRNNSLLTSYVDYANNNGYPKAPENMNPFDTYLAWETDLLYDSDTTDAYFWAADMPNGDIMQRQLTKTKGYIDELTISFSGNYKNKIYIGGTIGVPTIDYTRSSVYKEFDTQNNSDYFNSLSKTESLHTTGTGINLKLGIIFRPTQWLRIGAAYHSPTFYSDMKDSWSANMTSSFDNGDIYSSSTPRGTYNYELTTPMKFIGSVAFFIKQQGFISIDYETVDYSNAHLNADGGDFTDANNIINNDYSTQDNLRIGGEWRFDNFYFRGGYAIYNSAAYEDATKTFSTMGIGYKTQSFSVDIAYINSTYDSKDYIYDSYYVDPANNTIETNQIVLTLTHRF